VKDIIFGEDAAPFSNYSTATNWSIIRNIAINLARFGGYDRMCCWREITGVSVSV
jgi:hypothetical protein